MRFLNTAFILSVTLLVSACGTLVEGQAEKITLQTPGAYEAECTLDNGVRYKVETGETIQIMRSNKDLVVDCFANGNRHKIVTIPSDLNDWSIANVANGIVPGVAYDHFSKGMYEYPSVLTVDFTGIPARGYELPSYHDKDSVNPYEQGIEYYGPSSPKIPSDSTYLRRGVEKRNSQMDSNPFVNMQGADAAAPPPASAPKAVTATKGGSAEALTRSANPAVDFDPEAK